ncbi:MAG: hypothetical protein AB1414_06375 [bacterium]
MEVLKEYWKKDKPERWLFGGARKERYLSIRSVQKIFEQTCEKAGIRKEITIHGLKTQLCSTSIGGWNGFEIHSRAIRA